MTSSSLPNPTLKPLRPGRLWMTRSRSSLYNEGSLAEAAIAQDLEAEPDLDPENAIDSGNASEDESDSDLEVLRQVTSNPQVSMVGSYRRPDFTAAGPRAAFRTGLVVAERTPTKRERREARRDERSLLRDNHVIPPKHPTHGDSKRLGKGSGGFFHKKAAERKASQSNEETGNVGSDENVGQGSETAPLLGNPNLPYGGQDTPKNLDKKWEEAVLEGKIQTSWQREAKVLGRYSGPLVLTFLLQYSLTVASIFTVGHLGKVELGAVSLASMTANITGYAIFQGLATSLDTLCAQAYGSGRKRLVGLQTQRMVYFLWTITIPIGIIWICADLLLMKIVPEKDVAMLAGRYLKIVLIGAPGYACFESTKRYLQAQGLFSASLYVLLFCAPLNAFMNWLFVWKFNWGFTGAPIAVAVTDNLLPVGLVLYIRFFAGANCWPGLSKRAFSNWGPMVRLALPGLLMVEAECAAFEVLTLAASYFGTAHLAAQSVLSTIVSFTFQIPFPISIAASTRIANLIGATLADAAKLSARVAGITAIGVGILNVVLLSSLRTILPRLFTSEAEVIELVAKVLPLCAAFQLFDALAACSNGILRGLGRQDFGGYVQVVAYYVIAMPISMGTAFGLGWQLYGLWAGVAIALGLVACVEGVFLLRSDWEKSVEDAKRRNERG
ncbi:MAG: hypothetical protein Q9217_004278 [Psora testacea]